MRITYRQLRQFISSFSEDQLDSDVTVENLENNEACSAYIAISSDDSENGLEENHPVICFDYSQDFITVKPEDFQEYIESVKDDNGFGPVGG